MAKLLKWIVGKIIDQWITWAMGLVAGGSAWFLYSPLSPWAGWRAWAIAICVALLVAGVIYLCKSEKGNNRNGKGPFQGRRFFLCRWHMERSAKGTPFFVKLGDDGGAKRISESNTVEESGTWEYVNGEAVITWKDGWTAVLRQTPDGVKRLAYRTTDFNPPRPVEVAKAEKA